MTDRLLYRANVVSLLIEFSVCCSACVRRDLGGQRRVPELTRAGGCAVRRVARGIELTGCGERWESQVLSWLPVAHSL